MSKRGLFITLEGTDGVGKSTHAKLLRAWLARRRISAVLTREPGGGGLAEKIRALLLDPKLKMEDITELFLYEAARSEHAQHVIWPALHRGNWVICDRFTDATLAYQGAARGLSTDSIRYLNKVASGGLVPDLTIWLDFPPAEGLKKARARKYGRGDRLENEGVKFQKKVRGGYAAIARREPRRFRRVVVQDSIDATQELIRTLIEKRFL